MYVPSPGIESDTSRNVLYIYRHKPCVTLVNSCKYFSLNDFLIVSPFKRALRQMLPYFKIVQVNAKPLFIYLLYTSSLQLCMLGLSSLDF